mmetsp:Transcript_9887/g.24447  ORF Transcript_9887/g.24447 Transcript_9887/m.24447 type:complete len:210 (+) Transcript_9887:326-955(+)
MFCFDHYMQGSFLQSLFAITRPVLDGDDLLLNFFPGFDFGFGFAPAPRRAFVAAPIAGLIGLLSRLSFSLSHFSLFPVLRLRHDIVVVLPVHEHALGEVVPVLHAVFPQQPLLLCLDFDVPPFLHLALLCQFRELRIALRLVLCAALLDQPFHFSLVCQNFHPLLLCVQLFDPIILRKLGQQLLAEDSLLGLFAQPTRFLQGQLVLVRL